MTDTNATPNSDQSAEQTASTVQTQQPPQGQSTAQHDSTAQPQQAPQGFVPPTGQVPPQQPNPSFAHATSTPQNLPGMPLLHLTGGMKFGWAVVGFFMGPIAILIAWLTNAHNFPQAKNDAVKFSLIGFLASIVIVLLLLLLVGVTACSAVSSMSSSYYHYY